MKLCTLLVIAHHDDEFFFQPYLESYLSRGNKLTVLYTTKCNLGGQRILETERFFMKYSNDQVEVISLGEIADVKDGSSYKKIEEIYEKSFEWIVKEGKQFDQTLTHAWEGGHHDHDCAHLISMALSKSLQIEHVNCFFLYNSAFLPRPFFRVAQPFGHLVGKEVISISKLDALRFLFRARYYKTQMKTFLGLFPGLFLSWFIRGRCIYLKNSFTESYLDAPHTGVLLYERMFGVSFDEFRSSTKLFIQNKLKKT
jgi:hypothetical protein